MKTSKIFLASSYELKADRDQFEIFINRKNKEWVNREIFLELVIWEDALDCMEQTRLQDKYNIAIKDCDIFVLLFSSKVGEYTREEFEIAYNCFMKIKKPMIFVYFKNISIPIDKIKREDQKTLWSFQDRLIELQHMQTYYETTNDLIFFFNKQLDKLVVTGFFDGTKSNATQLNQENRGIDPLNVPHSLTLPPFKPDLFLGRKEDLLSIKDKFFHQDVNLLFITGEGGLGKTTLAAEYFHAYQYEYKHVIWVLMEKSIRESLLTNLSQPLGVQYDTASSPKNRLDKLVLAMNCLPKPCLLVVDDADNPEDLEETYLVLGKCTNFHILLTTRITKFHNVHRYPLPILPKENAIKLFREYYPFHQSSEDELFYQIREAVGGNTLVIEILAKNLAILNRNENTYSLTHLIEDIQKKGFLGTTESDSLETTYHADYKLTQAKPSDIVTAMYDLGNLTPDETSLLSVFAVLPTEKLEYNSLAMYFDPAIDPSRILRSLSQKGWIVFHEESRTYKCSPLIQEIIKRKNTKLPQDCQYLVEALSKQLDIDYKTGHPLYCSLKDASRLIRYGESVVRNLPMKSIKGMILIDNIGMYHKVTGDLTKANHYFTKYNQLAEQFFQNDSAHLEYKLRLAVSYKRMGDVSRSLGDMANAYIYFERYHQLAQELNQDDSENEIFLYELVASLERLGFVFNIKNEWNKALDYNTKAHQLSQEFLQKHKDNHRIKTSLAIASQNLGLLFRAIGNIEKALEYCFQFNSIEKELTETYPDDFGYQYAYGISHGSIGTTYYYHGETDKAMEHFTQYNQIFDQLYHAYPLNVGIKNELAVSLQFIGVIYQTKSELQKALEYIIKFYQIEKELYEDFPMDVRIKNGLAIASSWIGQIYSNLKDYEKSIRYLTEFNHLAKELHNDFPNDLDYKQSYSVSLSYLGDVNIAQNDLEKALSNHQFANEICVQLVEENPKNIDYQNRLAITYESLGLFYKEQIMNPELSVSYFKKGLNTIKELVEKTPGYKNYQEVLTRLEGHIKQD